MDGRRQAARSVAAVTNLPWLPWRQAMQSALYGPGGFYRRPAGPAAHFRTSVSASPLFAQALLRLAIEVYDELGRPPTFAIVDVGAGRGELLTQLADLVPEGFALVGVDLVERPPALPTQVRWCQGLDELSPVPYGLLVANEWLDNIALDIVEDGRLVEVDQRGDERLGGPASDDYVDWIERYAPGYERVEVGLPRDQAWSVAVSKLVRGVALAVDYCADGLLEPENDLSPTLTGFRDGREVRPVPDGSCDLTAHVLLQSCADAAEVEPGDAYLLAQRHALQALGVSAVRPPLEQASLDPGGYLRALARTSEAAELIDPYGLGRFGWLVQARETDLPQSMLAADNPCAQPGPGGRLG